MRYYLPVFAALAMSLSSAFVPSLQASVSDKKTVITISEPVTVEGTLLAAGQYTLKLQDSSANRDVIYIFNGEGTRLVTTVLAIPAYRLEPTGKSEFSFCSSPAGQPAALHTWFYPGDNSGFEFLQPHHAAAAESRAN